jgi:hypothetical protein
MMPRLFKGIGFLQAGILRFRTAAIPIVSRVR